VTPAIWPRPLYAAASHQVFERAALHDTPCDLLPAPAPAGDACIWDAETGEAVRKNPRSLEGRTVGAAVIYTPDPEAGGKGGDQGEWPRYAVSLNYVHAIEVRHAGTGAVLTSLVGHTNSIYALVAFTTAAGRILLASGSVDTTVRVWDPEAGTALHTLEARGSYVNQLHAFVSPQGRWLLASGDRHGGICVWDLACDAPCPPLLVRSAVKKG
jgi:WD40 repeat protein